MLFLFCTFLIQSTFRSVRDTDHTIPFAVKEERKNKIFQIQVIFVQHLEKSFPAETRIYSQSLANFIYDANLHALHTYP